MKGVDEVANIEQHLGYRDAQPVSSVKVLLGANSSKSRVFVPAPS
ncbi:hypothetical protein [Halomonas chromatireducens]|nr:hypothetical protein [Halomonas chromatireducens]